MSLTYFSKEARQAIASGVGINIWASLMCLAISPSKATRWAGADEMDRGFR